MPTFNARGLVGIVLPQEEAEKDAIAGDDGVGDETSQAGVAREVIVLDGDDGGRAPSAEPLITRSPLNDSDADKETAALEARWRRCTVYCDSEEASSRMSRPEEATEGGSRQAPSPLVHATEAGTSAQAGTTLLAGVKKRPWLFVTS